ncbi:MAG TPA: glycosyl hydrolase family 5 [Hyphomicrobium sp.]|nr:glycosyl hydrolase family 5 [Hyphomicrobium sp.]
MQRTLALAAAAVLGAMAAGTAATAADFGRAPPAVPVYPAYVPAQYVVVPQISYRCMRWTNRCDRRWGVGSPRFARCMWRHGC